MSNLNLSVDMDRVQSSVQAAIRPAIDAALKDIDIQKLIEKALKAKPAQEDGMFSLIYGRGRAVPCTMVERLVQDGISEMAKQYVARELAAQKPMLEEAFCQMMKGSANSLVKSFAAAMTKAIEDDDWGFEMKTAVTHKTSESSHD